MKEKVKKAQAQTSFTERFQFFVLGYLYIWDLGVFDVVKALGVKAVIADRRGGMGGLAPSDWARIVSAYCEARNIDYYFARRRRLAQQAALAAPSNDEVWF